MGLFNGKVNQTDVALDLLKFIITQKRVDFSESKKIIKSCDYQKKATLLKIIELIPDSKTNKELYIISSAYVLLGNEYNKEIILYLEKYIECGAYYEETPREMIEMEGCTINQLDANISTIYVCLGKAYERDHYLEKAIECYVKAIKLFDASAVYYVNLYRCYLKSNQESKAKAVIAEAKLKPYYSLNSFYRELINSCLEEAL